MWSADWAAGATAPITEEAAKLCGFILLMGLDPRFIRTANDGLIVGAFIGLGFAVFEDFLYAANAGTVTDAEVDGILDKKARKAFIKAAPHHKSRRARKHLRRAILDLAHDLAND